MMSCVTEIQNLMHAVRWDSDASYDPRQTVPNPWGAVRRKGHALGGRRAHAMQMKGHEFSQVVRTGERAIDPGSRPRSHPASLIQFEDGQQFRFPPIRSERTAFSFFPRRRTIGA
jgi:hypothetical protein